MDKCESPAGEGLTPERRAERVLEESQQRNLPDYRRKPAKHNVYLGWSQERANQTPVSDLLASRYSIAWTM